MLERLERGWRVVATGAGFITFGVGGLLLGAVVFPLLRLVVWPRERHVRWARGIIHYLFRFLVGMMRMSRLLSVEVRGAERLQGRGRLILANHPTLIDVVLLMSLIEQGDCIVKAALGRNPFMRGPVRAAGFVFNDSGEALVDDCVRSVRTGSNLIIFPEGTRSVRGEPLRLHRGAARVAVHGELDITPVRITCEPATLAKGEKWWRVPARRVHVRIEVGEPIAVSPFIAGAANLALAARHLNGHLTDYFSKEHELASA